MKNVRNKTGALKEDRYIRIVIEIVNTNILYYGKPSDFPFLKWWSCKWENLMPLFYFRLEKSWIICWWVTDIVLGLQVLWDLVRHFQSIFQTEAILWRFYFESRSQKKKTQGDKGRSFSLAQRTCTWHILPSDFFFSFLDWRKEQFKAGELLYYYLSHLISSIQLRNYLYKLPTILNWLFISWLSPQSNAEMLLDFLPFWHHSLIQH